jgi:hypothetical protein
MAHEHSRLTLEEIARMPRTEVMVPVSAPAARLLLQLPAQERDHAVATGVLRLVEIQQRRNGTAPDTRHPDPGPYTPPGRSAAPASRPSARTRPRLRTAPTAASPGRTTDRSPAGS